jgi:4-azaleucine resistance transporter AzlC
MVEMKKILRTALFHTLPVLFGYIFLGIAFGLLLQKAGYNYIWAFFISLTVYAGSMQFVLVDFFSSGLSLGVMAIMTLIINSRHIFYGLSFIDKFKKMGKLYPYMIFSLTDETYSLLCSIKPSDEIDQNKLFFAIAALNQIYWIIGSVIGALVGELITFDTTGIDFAMTALFVVIFIEQWKGSNNHIPALTGLFSSIICLILFGAGNFILPSLIITVIFLLLIRNRIPSKDKEVSVS